ncbi:MAG: outer membrane lipoprotein-sorting protein [Gammaproteobacteria bacterium]
MHAGAGPTAAEIVKKSSEIEGGDDSISRLSFRFKKSDGTERKLVYTMAWKEYGGREGVNDKVIFFSESSERHSHHDQNDDFAHSVLTEVDLAPRKPDLDEHTLLKDEVFNGHDDFVVESVPKSVSRDYPYQKTRRWITRDNFLPERIDYYDPTGLLIKRQTITWKRIGKDWVWKQVVGENLITDERTVLDITDIKLNSGLKDEVFSARTMRLGKDSIVP